MTAAAAALIAEGPQDAWSRYALDLARAWVDHVRFWRERHDPPPVLRYDELASELADANATLEQVAERVQAAMAMELTPARVGVDVGGSGAGLGGGGGWGSDGEGGAAAKSDERTRRWVQAWTPLSGFANTDAFDPALLAEVWGIVKHRACELGLPPPPGHACAEPQYVGGLDALARVACRTLAVMQAAANLAGADSGFESGAESGTNGFAVQCPATTRLAVYGVTDVAYISRYWTTFASMGCGEGDQVDFYLFVHYREDDYEAYSNMHRTGADAKERDPNGDGNSGAARPSVTDLAAYWLSLTPPLLASRIRYVPIELTERFGEARGITNSAKLHSGWPLVTYWWSAGPQILAEAGYEHAVYLDGDVLATSAADYGDYGDYGHRQQQTATDRTGSKCTELAKDLVGVLGVAVGGADESNGASGADTTRSSRSSYWVSGALESSLGTMITALGGNTQVGYGSTDPKVKATIHFTSLHRPHQLDPTYLPRQLAPLARASLVDVQRNHA